MYDYKMIGNVPDSLEQNPSVSGIGRRIRAIREEEDLSQQDLADKVNQIAQSSDEDSTPLNANRIQQYENGKRNPKLELSKQIAEALGVDVGALLDPQVACYKGAMYALFEMETFYDLRLKEVDGQMCICFGESPNDIKAGAMNKNLKAWYERRKQMETDILNAASMEERKKILHKYHMWECNFPHSTENDM